MPDTSSPTDSDGDGTWDSIAAGYDTVIPDGEPDVLVAAGGSLSYTLLRAVDLLQGPSRDPVTLTALSDNTGEQDSVTATLLLAAATDATLASFEAFSVGGTVVVEWRTAVEIGTLGFDLWRQRSGEDGYTRVNPRLVRGLLGPMQGGTYRVVDKGARPGDTVSYILAESDTRGRGRNFGPFTVTPLEELDLAKTSALPTEGVSRTANTSRVRGDRRAAAGAKTVKLGVPSGLVKVAVREPGLVWLANKDLASAFGVTQDTVTQWIADGSLWINAESPEPPPPFGLIFADGFESGDDARWNEDVPDEPFELLGVAWAAAEGASGIYFYGEALDSPYTEDNVYWVGVGHGAPMAWRSAAPSGAPTDEAFAEVLHFEEELWPLTSVMTDPEGDFWMWDYFFSNTPGYDVKTFVLPVPDPAADGGPGTLRVYLQGASVDAIEPNHNLEVRLNGSQLGGTWSWHGDEPYVVEVDFPQSLLVDGDNLLEIAALAAPGLEYDVVYLDAVEISYRRLYQALGDRLEGTAVAGTVAVTGFSSDDVTVYDITDPVMPVVLYSVNVEPGENGFAVSFEALEGMRFLVATPASAVSPVRVEADLASNLSDPANAGRYVVVAGPGLEGEAAAFAALREAQGLSAVVAPVEDVYDEFSGGIVTPWAIRDFLRHATENWTEAPEYVFLLGDGSLDHTNRDGLGESLVPAPFTVTGDGLVPSDNSLADWLGDDGVPELAIGRLPAQSAAEAAAYRQKVAAFEASDGDWKQRTLWLADEPDIGGDFGDDTDGIISAMPGGYAVERIYLDDLDLAEAWELTLEKMAAGALLVNFLGHGGLDRIADEGLLLTDDVELMENGERAPFLTALTCIVGRFDIPDFDTFAEALLLKGDGGAVAVWSPAAFSMNESAKRLGAHHIEAIAGGSHSTIGSTVRAALAAYATAGEGEADLVRIVTLLGDPATRIEW